jgi:spermidine synthase
MSKPRLALNSSRLNLFLFFFAIGFSALLFQTILLRECLVIMHGNELVLGTIFGVWLFGTGLGALAGARTRIPGRYLSYFLLAPALLPFLIVPALRLSRVFLSSPPGEYLSFPTFSLLLLFTTLPFTMAVGFIFPQGARALPAASPSAKGIGWIYASEALGSLGAGIGFTYILLHFFDPLTILGINLLLCFSILSFLFPLRPRYSVPGALILLLAVSFLPRLNLRLEQTGFCSQVPAARYLGSRDTPYAHLALASTREQTILYQNGEPALSFPEREENAKKAGAILTQHPHPENMLLIENGTGGLIRALLESPLEKLDYLQPDREAYDFLYPYLAPEDQLALRDARLRCHFTDGRDYLRRTSERYDLIFLNISNPANASLNRFFTREFFALARERLSPGGVLGISLSASENYWSGESFRFFDSTYRSLKNIFPEIVVSPGDPAYIFAGSATRTVSADPEFLGGRLSRLDPAPAGLIPAEFYTLFPPDRTREFQSRLGKTRGPENLDSRPATYLQNLILWNRFSDSHLSPLIRFFQGRGIFYLFLVPALLLGLFFLPRARRKPHPAPAVIFLLGFALMSISVFWLYLFQNLIGTLYRTIGLLNALFMLGLFLGAAIISLRLGDRGRTSFLLLILLPLTAGIALALPLIPSLVSGPLAALSLPAVKALILSGVLLTGICGGAIFPLAADFYLQDQEIPEPGRAGGLLDAADLVGAALGGFICGPFLLPVLGMSRSSLILAGLLVLAAFLVLSRRLDLKAKK